MKRLTIALALAASVLFAGTALGAGKKAAKKGNPTVVIKTSLGTIEAVLYQDKAPISVENFLAYVKDKLTLLAAQELGLLDKSEKDTLQENLNLRNRCGHPSKYRPGVKKVSSFIEDVVSTVFA